MSEHGIINGYKRLGFAVARIAVYYCPIQNDVFSGAIQNHRDLADHIF